MPLDKLIYCRKCERDTLHQVTKATGTISGNDEEYSKACSYYDKSQCLSCGEIHDYGNFLTDTAKGDDE